MSSGPPSGSEQQRAMPFAAPGAAQGAPAYMYPAQGQQWMQQPQPQVQWQPAHSSGTGSPMQGPAPIPMPMQMPAQMPMQMPVQMTMQMPLQGQAQAAGPAFYGSPYVHFPVPSVKKGPGRPPGSKNKRKLVQETDEDEPPTTRQRAAQSKSKFVAVEIPFVHDWDHEIPEDIRASCSKCTCNKAMFLCLPCGDYGFCHECLVNQDKKCRDLDCAVTCIGCGGQVEEYLKYFRAALNNAGSPST